MAREPDGHVYEASVAWARGDGDFTRGRYSRAHAWRFDGGLEVPASASPGHVPPPFSRADAIDPEEAFVAALSSCHMLFFLYFAAKDGLVVETYDDRATGLMARDAGGRLAMTRVTLDPRVAFTGARHPDAAEIADLHHRAHEACYLANSVRTEVVVAAATAGLA